MYNYNRLSTVQTFSLTTSSQASAKLGSQTFAARVSVSSTAANAGGAFVLFGDSTGLTVASSNGALIPTQWSECFTVTPGQTFYTIGSSSIGTVSLTELV